MRLDDQTERVVGRESFDGPAGGDRRRSPAFAAPLSRDFTTRFDDERPVAGEVVVDGPDVRFTVQVGDLNATVDWYILSGCTCAAVHCTVREMELRELKLGC